MSGSEKFTRHFLFTSLLILSFLIIKNWTWIGLQIELDTTFGIAISATLFVLSMLSFIFNIFYLGIPEFRNENISGELWRSSSPVLIKMMAVIAFILPLVHYTFVKIINPFLDEYYHPEKLVEKVVKVRLNKIDNFQEEMKLIKRVINAEDNPELQKNLIQQLKKKIR